MTMAAVWGDCLYSFVRVGGIVGGEGWGMGRWEEREEEKGGKGWGRARVKGGRRPQWKREVREEGEKP